VSCVTNAPKGPIRNQALDDHVILGRHKVLVDNRSRRGPDAFCVDQVFDADGDAASGPTVLPAMMSASIAFAWARATSGDGVQNAPSRIELSIRYQPGVTCDQCSLYIVTAVGDTVIGDVALTRYRSNGGCRHARVLVLASAVLARRPQDL
jgi:hypothetical protein